MNHQRQIAIGFFMFNGDHNGNFPWQLSETNGGTREKINSGHASEQFRPLLDYTKSFSVFVCPIDKIKFAATNVSTFSESNLSYFVNVNVTTNSVANIVLTGAVILWQMTSRSVQGYLITRPTKSWTGQMILTTSAKRVMASFLLPMATQNLFVLQI